MELYKMSEEIIKDKNIICKEALVGERRLDKVLAASTVRRF